MSRKAVFAVVLHLSRLGSSLLHVRANITNETYLFLVITIVADSKLRQRRLWTTAAAIAAVGVLPERDVSDSPFRYCLEVYVDDFMSIRGIIIIVVVAPNISLRF